MCIKIITCQDKESYFDSFHRFNKESSEVPVYIEKNREDLIPKINYFNNENFEICTVYQSNYGMIFSEEAMSYKKSSILCEKWIDSINEIEITGKFQTIVALGLYKDFSQNNVLDFIECCKQNRMELFFLLGRDLSSLTWFLAKQFFKNNDKHPRAVFSYKNLNYFAEKESDWKILDMNDLKSKDIKSIVEDHEWSELVFHGHGKEDHLNLADFTLCGLNDMVEKDGLFAPACGHGKSCFKDDTKTIPLGSVKSEKIFLLSCSNLPFYDSRLYSTKYNLILNAVDGYIKNIVASLGVQSADSPEIRELLDNSKTIDVGIRLHEKLDDVHPFSCIVNIGLPTVEKKLGEVTPTYRLTTLTKTILSRVSSYSSSMMLNKDHEINRRAQKIMADYSQLTRRGTYGVTRKDVSDFEQSLVNRVNPFSKRIAEIMFEDSSNELQDFDSFNIYRSIINKSSVKRGRCFCGNHAYFCKYDPEIPSLFKIESMYCYKCGDKITGMSEMPNIVFTCADYNEDGFKINYSIRIAPKQKGDVFWAIQLPEYVEKYSNTRRELHKIKFKSIRTETITGQIEFQKDTPLQSYYMKLFIVQNAGISISRSFFNLVETDACGIERNESLRQKGSC